METIDLPKGLVTFVSCYDASRNPAFDIFEFILSDAPDVLVWLGDFAYVSRSERVNYLKYLDDPAALVKALPSLGFKMLLKLRFWLAKRLGHEREEKNGLSWYEWLKGGFDILPAEEIERRMNDTNSNVNYRRLRENTRVIGIWDDNDYGVNDGEWTNPIKHE